MAGEVTLQNLLQSHVITRVISRIKTPMSKLQNFWGMGPGGPNENQAGGHYFQWDIFDKTRVLAQGRPFGTGPANVKAQPIGTVNASAYRSHESLHLLDENLYRTRVLGEFWDRIDSRGQNYVARQADYLAQKFKNTREFIVSRMMRGGFDIAVDGDTWSPVDIGSGNITVNMQIPAGNKLQLNMLGAGDIIGASWALAGTDILGHLMAINAANEQLHGWPTRHLWVNSKTFGYMMNNTSLQTIAGTANTVLDMWQPTGERSAEGVEDTGFNVRFRGVPWLDVHVYDAGLTVNGNFSKFIPDNVAVFCPEPTSEIAEWLAGSELIRENVISEPREAMGFTAWVTPQIDPAGFSLKAVDSGLSALYLPNSIQYATVIF